MAKDKKDEQTQVEQETKQTAESYAVEAQMHLDDFCNHIERTEGKRELLAAFAKRHMASGNIKRTHSEWIKAFREFENEIPS